MKNILFFLMSLLLIACQGDSNSSSSELLDMAKALGENPAQCRTQSNQINQMALQHEKCHWLSNYGLFDALNLGNFSVKKPGIEYQLNSELFTNFSKKRRFIFLPDRMSITFNETEIFEFPTGSVIVKVFSLQQHNKLAHIEIRLLIKRASGWIFLPYTWLEEKQDAFLNQNGHQFPTHVLNNNQQHDFIYNIPSRASCGECHQISDNKDTIHFYPIGPKARHLNKVIEYQGQYINQLQLWKNLNILSNAPEDLSSIDTAPNWQDESANLQDRAKAYLDINCAHCHNKQGSAALSGLRLEYWRKSIGHSHGVCNSSHGWRGGGFDIWPGRGDISSIPIRMRHTEAKDRMPPIGRSLVHEPAAQLISDWIDTLPSQNCVK